MATVTNQAVELWDVTDIYAPEALSTIDDAIVDEFDPLTRTAFSPDGEVLAVSTGKNVALYDVTDPRDPSKITTVDTPPGGASYVTFSPDGRLMAVGDLGAPPAPEFERFVEIWDVSDIASPIRLDSVVAHRAFIREIMFSPDGRLLVTVADRSAKLWDVSDPSAIAPLAELPWIPGGAWTVAFAPDGQTLAVGGGGPFTTLWDVSRPAEPVELADLPGHVNVVYSLVFSPDGTRLATGSGDNTVRLWDVTDPEDPELLARLTRSAGLEGGITRILFAHDGGSLVATINTAPAALWDLDIDRVAERICARAGVGITEDEWRRFLPDLTYDPACD